MKQLKLILGLLLLFAAGVVGAGYFILNSAPQTVEFSEQIPNVVNQFSSLNLFFVLCAFLLLFFISFLGIVLFMIEILKKSDEGYKNQKLIMANLEVVSRTLIESRHLVNTSAFFKGITNVYQNLYESILKIVSFSFFFPERFKSENSDLFSFCRAIQLEIHKNPEMIIKFRQTFKKNEKVQMEMAKLLIKYERFITLLKQYDKDGLLYQYITEGVVGEVMDILSKVYEEVKAEYKAEYDLKQKESVIITEEIIVDMKTADKKKEDESVLDFISF